MEPVLAAILNVTEAGLFIAAGIFTRVGAVLFLLPGLGERAVPMRVRLGAALVITFLLAPLIAPLAPATPQAPVDLLRVIAAEATVGLVIGFAFRVLIFALQIAGFVAAQHISIAQMLGAGVAPEPEPTIATFLGFGGIVLLMMAGLHVHVIATLARYYDVFPFGQFPPGPDLAEWAIARMSETFALGVTLAAPFVAVGFVYNLALGALNRAMPQLLVALVGVPFIIWIGMVVLYHILPALYDRWDESVRRIFFDPLGGFG